jgi:hypothetical protein
VRTGSRLFAAEYIRHLLNQIAETFLERPQVQAPLVSSVQRHTNDLDTRSRRGLTATPRRASSLGGSSRIAANAIVFLHTMTIPGSPPDPPPEVQLTLILSI